MSPSYNGTVRLYTPSQRTGHAPTPPHRARTRASRGEPRWIAPDQPARLANRPTHTHTPTVYTCTATPCTTRTHAHTTRRGPDAPDPASSRPYTRWSCPVHRRGLLVQQFSYTRASPTYIYMHFYFLQLIILKIPNNSKHIVRS